MDLEDIKRSLRAEIKKRENEQYATFQCNVRQMCKDVLAKLEEQESVITKLKADNERLWDFRDELVKDCKWLPTTITPDKSGFETMVQCTNGKKRVASFRMFDFRWYDVNNGNKLNVVKWLWQPRMPSEEKEL